MPLTVLLALAGTACSTPDDGDSEASTENVDTSTTAADETEAGDGDTSMGDGDGDTSMGDGDGDTTVGDGDGDTTGDGDGDTTGDGDGETGNTTNPCLSDVTFTMEDLNGGLAAGYCALWKECGYVGGPMCDQDEGNPGYYMRFGNNAIHGYYVTGYNFDITASSHGTQTGQTLTSYSGLPEDTDITMDLYEDFGMGTGTLVVRFSGNDVTVLELQDPRFPAG